MNDAQSKAIEALQERVSVLEQLAVTYVAFNPRPASALSPPATPQASEDVISAASDIARSMAYDRALANQIISALADASLLATPVTVTMEECQDIVNGLFVGPSSAREDLAQSLRRVLGDRIQIAGEQS